ncbi:chemotaxis protein CheW [Fervidibacillus albus]|uniref:Chemotaxis protein CheW n=1 Tax=Fervidibacillus albus TaxID=2980026 RepID=A0A9E8LX04_9BACI|nr:chemotaxis protein CheW [Fervidibacillus albus]WAA11121.1 chemotaxis protein CheW [Fervidibacillus albus]
MEKYAEQSDRLIDDKIIEFVLGEESFGIPVSNVREIIRPSNITPVPRSHPFIEGITEIRGEVLPVIHLAKALSVKHHPSEEERFIIGEFGDQRVSFHVDAVRQIVASENREQPDDLYGGKEAYVNEVMKTENTMILLLDYEKLLEEIRN